MKQQEANQFSEGLNLDTHPIAMSNKLLAGALNATMITMNGNELILLNDMGNGRVETANLPAGFVPVGMLEFGGIIYVASYNPLTNLSQIGSFPSPERNISSDELDRGNDLKFAAFSEDDIITSTVLKLKITPDVLRPGDKFSISMPSVDEFKRLLLLIKKGVFKLSVCTMDSNGTLIDITDSLQSKLYTYLLDDNTEVLSFIYNENVLNKDNSYYTLESMVFHVYKSKVIGELYLKLLLILPDNITYPITGNKYKDVNGYEYKKYKIYFPMCENNFYELPLHNITKYHVIISSNDPNVEDVIFDVPSDYLNEASTKDLNFIFGSEGDDSRFYYYAYESPNIFEPFTITLDKIDGSKNSDIKVEVGDDIIHKYTVIPYFDDLCAETTCLNSGWLENYKFTGAININKLADGTIDFEEFRYYNNTDDGVFTFNYTINAYLNSNLYINKLSLCTVNKKDIVSAENYYQPHEIVIRDGLQFYFGNFLYSCEYTNLTNVEEEHSLDVGQIYLAYLKAEVIERKLFDDNKSNSETKVYLYSEPFILMTTSATNYLYTGGLKKYINASASNNPVNADGIHDNPIERTNSNLYDDYLAIPCKIDWRLDLIENNLTEVNLGTGIYLKDSDEYDDTTRITYTKTLSGNQKFLVNPNITVRVKDDFPFEIGSIDAKFDQISRYLDTNINPTTSYSIPTKGTIQFDEEFTNKLSLEETLLIDGDDIDYDYESRILTINIHEDNPIIAKMEFMTDLVDEYRQSYVLQPYLRSLESQRNVFGLDLFVNLSNSTSTTRSTSSTTSATTRASSEDRSEYEDLEAVDGSGNNTTDDPGREEEPGQSTSEDLTINKPTWHEILLFIVLHRDLWSDTGSSTYSNIYIYLISPNDVTRTGLTLLDFNKFAEWRGQSEKGGFLISSYKSRQHTWKEINKLVKNYLINGGDNEEENFFDVYDQSELPIILFWQGTNDNNRGGETCFRTCLYTSSNSVSGLDPEYDYTVPIMLATDGKYYPLNNYGHAMHKSGYKTYVSGLIDSFNHTFIPSNIQLTYRLLGRIPSSTKYIYTEDYSKLFNIPFIGKTDVSIKNDASNSLSCSYDPINELYNLIMDSSNPNSVFIQVSTKGALKLPKLTLIDLNSLLKFIDTIMLQTLINSSSVEKEALQYMSFSTNTLTLYILLDDNELSFSDGNGLTYITNYPYFKVDDKYYNPNDTMYHLIEKYGSYNSIPYGVDKETYRIAKYFKEENLKLTITENYSDYMIYLNSKKLNSVPNTNYVSILDRSNGNRIPKDTYGSYNGSSDPSIIRGSGFPLLDILLTLEKNVFNKLTYDKDAKIST